MQGIWQTACRTLCDSLSPVRRRVLLLMAVFIVAAATGLAAQERFALVIGNGDYETVTKLKNASLNDMENAVIRLGNRLGQSPSSYGVISMQATAYNRTASTT